MELGFQPGAAGWEARMLPPCYAALMSMANARIIIACALSLRQKENHFYFFQTFFHFLLQNCVKPLFSMMHEF